MFRVEQQGKLVLFPNLFRIGVFEIDLQSGSAMCDVTVHVDGTKVTFRGFINKQAAEQWVMSTFKFDEPVLPELPKEEDPFVKKKKKW